MGDGEGSYREASGQVSGFISWIPNSLPRIDLFLMTHLENIKPFIVTA